MVRLHLTHGWKQRLTGSISPGTSAAVINFIIWVAVLIIVLLMAVSTAG